MTVKIGLKIGNWLVSCGNQLRANLAKMMLENKPTALDNPIVIVPTTIGEPGITAFNWVGEVTFIFLEDNELILSPFRLVKHRKSSTIRHIWFILLWNRS